MDQYEHSMWRKSLFLRVSSAIEGEALSEFGEIYYKSQCNISGKDIYICKI